MAINSDRELYAWGRNNRGQVGDGTNSRKTSPIKICITTLTTSCATNWVKVAAGNEHSLAINAAGELYAWGKNNYGQLGDGTTTHQNSPLKIGASTNWVSVAAGGNHGLAINAAGELYVWGYNNYGQLGDDGVKNLYKTTPVLVKK